METHAYGSQCMISMHRTCWVFLACFVFGFIFYFDEFMALVCLFCLVYVSTSLKENLCSCCEWTDINQIILEAQQRWLRPAEICEILRNYQNFRIAPEPPNKPLSKILCCVVFKMLNFACDLMSLSLYHLIKKMNPKTKQARNTQHVRCMLIIHWDPYAWVSIIFK